MKRTFYAILVAMILVGSAYAQPFGGHGRGMRGGIFHALIELDLSDSQKHELALILKVKREGLRATHEDFREAMAMLREAVHAYEGDESAIREASRAVAEIGEEMAVERAKLISEVERILTPQQLKTLEERRAEMLERRMAQRGHHGHILLDEWIEMYSR
jgi:Spy/CpxP family protein refolding chaperone